MSRGYPDPDQSPEARRERAARRAYFIAYRARPGYKERTADRRREQNTRQRLAARTAFEASLRIGAS